MSRAQVVELVDTPDLGSGTERYVGSSPILGTLSWSILKFCNLLLIKIAFFRLISRKNRYDFLFQLSRRR
jgi:hypothetical protein